MQEQIFGTFPASQPILPDNTFGIKLGPPIGETMRPSKKRRCFVIPNVRSEEV